jgi:hypothetical protein
MAEWYEDDMGGSPLGQVTSRFAGWLGFKDRPSRWAGSGHGRVEANAAGQETRLGTVAGLVRDAATATPRVLCCRKSSMHSTELHVVVMPPHLPIPQSGLLLEAAQEAHVHTSRQTSGQQHTV